MAAVYKWELSLFLELRDPDSSAADVLASPGERRRNISKRESLSTTVLASWGQRQRHMTLCCLETILKVALERPRLDMLGEFRVRPGRAGPEVIKHT
jgi:hypothetical protein